MNVDRAPAPDVAGPAEVRKLLGGISRQRLAQLRAEHDDFPEHVELEIGRVWDRAAIRAWQQARTYPKRKAMYVLVTHYKRHGQLGYAARAAKIHTTTARRWLRELRIPLPSER